MNERMEERLRRAAQTYRRLGNHSAEGMFLEAADTIWELRDDLQRTNAENARLRERITTQKQTIQAYRDESREWREVAERAQAENAKLREELADAPKCDACEAMLDCDECLRADGSHKERRRLSIENAKLRGLARWASMLLTGIMPYVDYSRCTALEAVAAWKVKASELRIEASDGDQV